MGIKAERRSVCSSLEVGIVPCTGAVLILLYAPANDVLLSNLLLVVATAAGMAIAISWTFAAVSDYGGALLIMLIGAALFWSTW